MKASKVKELIKQSLLELEAEKKNTSNSGPMTPEEEEMIKRYEEEEANKYALEKEEPLEEGDVMKKAREIVAKHKEMTESEEGPEDISDYDRGKIETGKANTLARSINAAIVEVDPELHVETFAKGVAQVLKREYGTHLSAEFIAALRDNLRGYEDIVTEADRIVESWKRKNLLKETKKEEKPAIKILKDLYHFDKLGSLAAKDDVDEKYHKGAKLVFKKGKVVKDDTQHDDSEYEMIMKSKRLKKGTEYTLTESIKKGRKILKESADSIVNKHSASLLKALGARAKYPEDEIAYREVEKHLKAIATELGLDASLPFMEDEMYSGKAKPEEALEYTKEMFNSWLEDSGMTESKRRKTLKENTDLLDQYLSIIQSNDMDSDQAHNYLENQGLDPQQIDSIMNYAFPTSSDYYEESDYIKRRKKEMYEADFKVQRVSKVVFPNGLSFRKGEEDMEGGIVLFIEKFPNGYAVSGNEFDWDNQLYGDEAYTYYYDLDGNESTEDEIVPDGYFKTDSDIS